MEAIGQAQAVESPLNNLVLEREELRNVTVRANLEEQRTKRVVKPSALPIHPPCVPT